MGAGPIGCELAQAFQRLGTEVTLVSRTPRIMPRQDTDVSKYMLDKFQREGINILSEVKINYLQAILGCRIDVDTVDGTTELTIPAGTQPNTVLNLENKGVPRLGNPVSRGDHLINVSIEIPTKVSGDERKHLEELAKLKGARIGKGGKGGFSGLFGL